MAQAAAKKRNQTAEASKPSFHGSFCWNELMTRDIEVRQAVLPRHDRLELRADEDGLGHLLDRQVG